MADVLIAPTPSVLRLPDADLPILEVTLGATPQGIVLLVGDPDTLHHTGIEVMNRLAEHGYESLAAEVSRGRSDTVVAGMLERAAERGWSAEQTGMVGLGLGGRAVLDAATTMQFGAAVSLSPTDPAGSLTGFSACAAATPWLGLFGADDPGAAAPAVRAMHAGLDAGSDVHTLVVRYPGVGREFYRHADDGIGYAAWYDGWQRTIEWLEARVAPRPTPLAQQWRRRATG